ncbi:hypothetical protein EKD04_017380 [Chloroflexales bacterium ZM16-3]|nr:hypothetical protein [Chloroflexales bacterium ZM16-3]
MSELDMFGQVVAAAAAPVPVAKAPVGKTKLVFGQPAPTTTTSLPPRVSPPSAPRGPAILAAMPPALTMPRSVRPAEEHRIDEAQAACLLFAALARLAERRLYELRLGRHDYIPVIPGVDDLRIAAELLMADPAVALRLGLLAGTFRESPPAATKLAATLASVPPARPQEPPADGAGGGVALDTEPAPAPQEPAQPVVPREPPVRRKVAPPPASADLPDRIAAVIDRINTQRWWPAMSLVQALPEGIRPHWEAVWNQAQEAWELLADDQPAASVDRAETIVLGIDCQPVRDVLEARLVVRMEALRGVVAEVTIGPATIGPATKPQRRSGGRDPGQE